MKRRYIIIVSIFFLICIMAGIMSLAGCKNDQPDSPENSTTQSCPFLKSFRENDPDDVKNILKENGIDLVYAEEESVFGVDRYQFDDLILSAFFVCNENEITNTSFTIETNIIVFQSSDIDEETTKSTKSVLSKIIGICNELFCVDVSESYNFYGSDGTILDSSSPDYTGWLKGESKFGLFVRDDDSSLWKIYGEMLPIEGAMSEVTEGNDTKQDGNTALVFSFDCISDPELFKDVTADITLK